MAKGKTQPARRTSSTSPQPARHSHKQTQPARRTSSTSPQPARHSHKQTQPGRHSWKHKHICVDIRNTLLARQTEEKEGITTQELGPRNSGRNLSRLRRLLHETAELQSLTGDARLSQGTAEGAWAEEQRKELVAPASTATRDSGTPEPDCLELPLLLWTDTHRPSARTHTKTEYCPPVHTHATTSVKCKLGATLVASR
jgi:hypothetical protein